MQAILDFTLEELESYLKKHNFTVFVSRQIFHWIYKKGVYDFSRMLNLSKQLRSFLKSNFHVFSLRFSKKQISSDGTRKFLFMLSDEQGIESVLIPNIASTFVKRYQNKGSGKRKARLQSVRFTACISTQVGCKFACRFCASGLHGWQRDLRAGEIIEQVIHLRNALPGNINNLVFMGIGEPLDNYDNVLKAIRILNSPYCLNIGARKITLSTCGLISGIKKLAEEDLQIELSISLHAADNKTRTFLMPINKKYPLEELLEACRAYFKRTKRQITFEYVLIEGINSDLKQARTLTSLIAGLDAKVNLIPASRNNFGYSAPDKKEILLFRDVLLKSAIPVTIRRSRGADIEAACGQLRLKSNEKHKTDFKRDL